jgi:ankyrin repeat protein
MRERPDLDQLKRQAKELLDAYLAGDAAATAEVNAHYRGATAGAFALHHAQLVLARSYGFESWPKLKAYVDGVTMRRFVAAVQAGDLAGVRAMLRQRPELVHMDTAGTNEHRGLHYAVLRRDVPMVRLLMEAGADPRQGIYPHREATTALTLARDRGYADVVAAIEEEEQHRRESMSCPNATVSPVQDRINDAIRGGEVSEAIRLLEADASLLHACDRTGGSPLHTAAAVLDVEMVRWLVDRRADARKVNLSGQTPLDLAVQAVRWRNRAGRERFPAVAELLIRRGCEVSPAAAAAMGDLERLRAWRAQEPRRLRESNRMLEVAVIFGHMEVLRFLLDCGLDPDERQRVDGLEEAAFSWGGPLWHAAAFSEHEMAELLLARGADPNGNVYASGWPIGHTYRTGDQRMRELLWRYGARPEPSTIGSNHDVTAARGLIAAGDRPCEDTTSYGCRTVIETLLWGACNGGDAEIVAMCLPHIRRALDDVWWNGMLEQPMRVGKGEARDHPACLKLMLDTGVDPNVTRRFGQRALHFLCSRVDDPDAQLAFARALLDAGAGLDVRDDLLRSTPLGWAARWGREELVTLLLEHGAPAHEPDAEPWAQPLAWAVKSQHPRIAEVLREHGAR